MNEAAVEGQIAAALQKAIIQTCDGFPNHIVVACLLTALALSISMSAHDTGEAVKLANDQLAKLVPEFDVLFRDSSGNTGPVNAGR
jgi:hypothetical protein